MNARKGLSALIAMIIALAIPTAGVANTSDNSTVLGSYRPTEWNVEWFETNYDVTLTSTVFIGDQQYPLISFNKYGTIVTAHPAGNTPGDCGPGATWVCELADLPTLAGPISSTSLSQVAVIPWNTPGVYVIGLVFEGSNHKLYLFRRMYSSNLEILLDWFNPIYELDSNVTLTGQPSLAFDSDSNPHIAAVFHRTDNVDYLQYISFSGYNNTSCGALTPYTCETIYSTTGPSAFLKGSPSIVLTNSGTPRIAYLKTGILSSNLMYAYPQANANYHPNCGPGGDTWRCIVMSSGIDQNSDLDMDMGASRAQLAWTLTDGLNQTWVYHASYVGRDGNCGQDYRMTLANPPTYELLYLWECTQVAEIALDAIYQYVSIQVDDAETPVIAFNAGTEMTFDLGVVYKDPLDTWVYTKIDGHGINTGSQPALALDNSGRGFIAYTEEEEYSPNLKIAYQDFYTYLPGAMK